MSYCYTTVEPGAPITLSYLQKVIDIIETNNIELPDLKPLQNHTLKNSNPKAYRNFNWTGDYIVAKGLSLLLKQ